MNSKELFDAGRLTEAIEAMGAEVRNNPTDARRRTFLFELLCFAGEYDRAEKQLDVLSQDSQAAATGALVYRAALHAERRGRRCLRNASSGNNSPKLPIAPIYPGF